MKHCIRYFYPHEINKGQLKETSCAKLWKKDELSPALKNLLFRLDPRLLSSGKNEVHDV